MELVMNLAELVKKLIPFLAVIGEETTFLILLCDTKDSLYIGIFTAIEIAKIGLRQY